MQIQPVTFAQLLKNTSVQVLSGTAIQDVWINGISFDSRIVKPGDIFVALVGGSVDGHRYIPAAIKRGAAAIVGTLPFETLQKQYFSHSENTPPYVQVADSRLVLAYISAGLFGFPGRKLNVIGVTGTDGKTTTSNLIYQILIRAGLSAGIVSTVNAVIGDEVIDTGFHVTTPEAPMVQGFLDRMVEAGISHTVLEATSHGLAQHRVTASEFDIGVVTNITHEHLDYHGSYEHYRASKGLLFKALSNSCKKPSGIPKLAVLNRDDQSYAYLDEITEVRKVCYSLNPEGADLWAENIQQGTGGIQFDAVWRSMAGKQVRLPVKSNLLGDYNISNCMAAIATAIYGLALDPDAIQQGIAALQGLTGRMERVEMGQDFTAMVDFAHTPNALRRALQAARQMTERRVIAVFGSAGLRDRQKRRMMAEVSTELAEITILTAEDPRTESLDAILAEMAVAAKERGGVEGKTFFSVPDRGEALRTAVGMAQKGDVVIACGKGHEQSMCFGEVEYHWDDQIALRAALADLLGVAGPEMPYLPTSNQPKHTS